MYHAERYRRPPCVVYARAHAIRTSTVSSPGGLLRVTDSYALTVTCVFDTFPLCTIIELMKAERYVPRYQERYEGDGNRGGELDDRTRFDLSTVNLLLSTPLRKSTVVWGSYIIASWRLRGNQIACVRAQGPRERTEICLELSSP